MPDLYIPVLVALAFVAVAFIVRTRKTKQGQPAGIRTLNPLILIILSGAMLIGGVLDILVYVFVSNDVSNLLLGIAAIPLGAYLLLSTRQTG
jgi:hypothetical protein